MGHGSIFETIQFNSLVLQMGKLRPNGLWGVWHGYCQNLTGSSLQFQGENRASGILALSPTSPVSSLLGKLSRDPSQFPAGRMFGWALSMVLPSQAVWGESDYVGHLVIRKENPSPLNAGCFIWSQRIGLALIVCPELVDKRSTPKGNISLKG